MTTIERIALDLEESITSMKELKEVVRFVIERLEEPTKGMWRAAEGKEYSWANLVKTLLDEK